MSTEKKKIRGTREWAVANIDCCTGCSHGCRYCYARYDAVVRTKRVTDEEWQINRVEHAEVEKEQPHYSGQVMFPCTHDIVPENIDACITTIENLLAADNKVLIVSKPHLSCITTLCNHFEKEKDSLLFRFTITAANATLLSFWEPGAPVYQERLDSLKYAFEQGFSTSVSVEPMLDPVNVEQLVEELMPYVTHSIWLGKMNKLQERVVIDSEEVEAEIKRIDRDQSDARIKAMYHKLKKNPLVFWKESIKEVLGLKRADVPGLDR